MGNRILIIDDEDHIRRVMRMTLEAAGHEAGEAADGPRGLETFGDGSTWDAVLLDQRMPGMDGLETLRRIKERSPGARVIMVTAYASIELAVDAMKLGATDFVRKPMTPEILRNAVTASLAKPVAPRPALSGPAFEQAVEQPHPSISRLTLNGFRLWPETDAPGSHPSKPHERAFMVQHPDGRRQHVVVEIAAEAIGYVEERAHRRLSAPNAFWTSQAERVLNGFLWKEGKVPAGGRLTIDVAGIDRDVVLMATRWEGAEE